MYWRSIPTALLLGAALAVACGDDDSGPIQGEAVPEDDAPQQVPDRTCAAFIGCDCDGFVDTALDDVDACEAAVRSSIEDDLEAGQDAGLTYDGQCVGDILAAFSAIECRSLSEIAADEDLVARIDVGCKLFYGDDAAGTACTALDDANGDSCARGLVCVDEVCRADQDLALGDGCDIGDACPYGSICTSLEPEGENTCIDLPAIGSTCLGAADLCDLDGYCDQASKTCTALPGVGAECAAQGNLIGQRCRVDATCEEEECVPAPAAGEPCTAECQSGTTCDDGVCQVERPLACAVGLFG
ncbi:MAG: hypothetical protein IAG13_37720 [Deltaproteobacteria bacterium]|nr:hypothetical protein [Nannocystaceae bacterium]